MTKPSVDTADRQDYIPPMTKKDDPSSDDAGLIPPVTRRTFIGTAAAGAVALLAKPAEASPIPISNSSVFRIHPGIGIARLGNADPEQFFIGPEVPGYGPSGAAPGTATPPYKSAGLVKPQAARFRIFRYEYVGGLLTPIEEVTLDTANIVSIEWTAHLANKKASFNAFYGPAGESSPYSTTAVSTAPGPLRNAGVTTNRAQLLEIDLGPRSVSGKSQPPVAFDVASSSPATSTIPLKDVTGVPCIDYLGKIRTDDKGRLIVQGGKGRANYKSAAQPSLPTYANNDGWFDDTSDGPVTANVTVTVPSGGGTQTITIPADGAWVICGPPDFAPGVRPIVTLYDLLVDMAVRVQPLPANALYNGGALDKIRLMKAAYVNNPNDDFPSYTASFAEDVFPLLRAAYDMWWVTFLATTKHDSLLDPSLGNPGPASARARQGVFTYLRPPIGQNGSGGPQSMPHLLGDDPYIGQEPDAIKNLAVTRTQYGMLRNWTNGNFTAPSGPLPTPAAAPPPANAPITPDGLDRAALENCQGGAFFPGIEVSWQIRNPALFTEPFRINLNATSAYLGESQPVGPGHFSRQGAVPWHADFNDCRAEGKQGWWPAQRADSALPSFGAKFRLDWARADTGKYPGGQATSSHADMVANWWKYGFVLYTPDPQGKQPAQFVESERNPVP